MRNQYILLVHWKWEFATNGLLVCIYCISVLLVRHPLCFWWFIEQWKFFISASRVLLAYDLGNVKLLTLHTNFWLVRPWRREVESLLHSSAINSFPKYLWQNLLTNTLYIIFGLTFNCRTNHTNYRGSRKPKNSLFSIC